MPEPADPQSFNRYSYVGNRPLTHTDPSGHCQGTYDPATGVATEDQACWNFLYNEFCSGGNVAICKEWYERLFTRFFCYEASCIVSFGAGFWTEAELRTLRDAIADAITALTDAGFDGGSMLAGVTFYRSRSSGDSFVLSKNTIVLANVLERTIWHEIGHALDFKSDGSLRSMFAFASGNCANHGMGGWLCSSTGQSGFYWRDYGRDAGSHHHWSYGWIYRMAFNAGDTWADAFAAWVFHAGGGNPQLWVSVGDSVPPVQWNDMFDAVRVSLDDFR